MDKNNVLLIPRGTAHTIAPESLPNTVAIKKCPQNRSNNVFSVKLIVYRLKKLKPFLLHSLIDTGT